MSDASVSVSRLAGFGLGAPAADRGVVAAWRRLMTALFDSYRPELHYMRGPGPKWQEKHGERAPFGQR
jgi:hypothetical protein